MIMLVSSVCQFQLFKYLKNTSLCVAFIIGLFSLQTQAESQIDTQIEARAEPVNDKFRQTWASFTWDNDSLVGEDGAYTNGFSGSVYYVYPEFDSRETDLSWYFNIQRRLLPKTAKKHYVELHNFGQLMITPTDISISDPAPEDGIYAGLLFWQGSVLMANTNYSDISSLLLGIIGPLSGAEQTQKVVHDFTGSTEPLGWDTQLENEVVFMLSRARFWRDTATKINSLELDWVGGLEANLGTFDTSVDGSFYMRLGEDLEGSYSTFALVSHRQSNPMAFPGSYYFYAGVSLNYGIHSIITDGNTYRDSRSFDHDKYGDLATLGFTWSAQTWGMSFNINKSDMVLSTDTPSMKFASLTLYWRYN